MRAYGVNAFAKKIHMARQPNLLRAIGLKANPTHETLSKILKPFGLQLSVAPDWPASLEKGGVVFAEEMSYVRESCLFWV